MQKLKIVSILFFVIVSFVVFNLIISFFYLPVNNSVFAQEMEVEYPELNKIKITETTSFPLYVKYIFNWAIIIGAIIAFGSLIYGGVRYLTSTGNPEALKDAKNQIFSAFMGLIILLASGLIFNTINPQLTTIQLIPLELKQGVKLSDAGGQSRIVGISHSNLETSFKNFKPIKAEIIGSDIEARVYNDAHYTGSFTPWFNKTVNISDLFKKDNIIRSVKIRYISPGVYIYDIKDEVVTKNGKNEMRREINSSYSISDLTKGYGWRPEWSKYIQIKNLEKKTEKTVVVQQPTDYLAVLHQGKDFQGFCRVFFEKTGNYGNINKNEIKEVPTMDNYGRLIMSGIPDPRLIVSSAEIFQIEREQVNSCKIIFYKEPNYQGKNCTIYGDGESYLQPRQPEDIEKSKMCNPADVIKNAKSMQINGNCAVVIWRSTFWGSLGERFPLPEECQTFTSDVPDFGKTYLGIGGTTNINSLAIYPLK